jgi:AcrR family transcriptional regulator
MARERASDTESILAAAARVFERKGYSEATIGDIAAEAGISKPTVYQYAKSKQWLLETIVERVIYPMSEQVAELLAADLSPREKLERYIVDSVHNAARLQSYYAVLLSDHTALSPPAAKRFRAWVREVDATIEGLLIECVAEGSVRADIDLDTATNLLNSLLTGVHRWYRPKSPMQPDEIAAETMKFLSGFLLAPTGTRRQRPRIVTAATAASGPR